MSGASLLPGQVAARVVPDSDLPARLTVFAAAFLGFLTVLALALTLAATHLAARWERELSQGATIRLTAEGDGAKVQAALDGFPGIASIRLLTAEEHRALLAPWLGSDVPIDALPLPATMAVEETGAGPDVQALRARLAEVAPGAVYDDHAGWRDPIRSAASRLRIVAVSALVLIAATLAAMVVLAAQAALAANGRVIEVLRLVGARDAFIVAAFTRRFTLRATIGAALGAVAGTGAVMLAGGLGQPGLLGGPVFAGAGWLLPLALPPGAAALAFLATRWAARRTLREIP